MDDCAAPAPTGFNTSFPGHYFPHFMATMIVIYFLGNGVVTMTLILCLTAVVVVLVVRDRELIDAPECQTLDTPRDAHAFHAGYRKGYLDGLREHGSGMVRADLGRRCQSPPAGHSGGRHRLMGPPVIDRASARMHMIHNYS